MLINLYKFFFGTFRGRLILGVAAINSLIMLAFIGYMVLSQQKLLIERQTEEVSAYAYSLATSSAGWIEADDLAGLQELVKVQSRHPELSFAIITDQSGKILAHTDPHKLGLFMLDLPENSNKIRVIRRPDLIDVTMPAIISGTNIGWVRIGIGQSFYQQRVNNLFRDGAFIALVALIGSSALVWGLGLGLTRRLYAIHKAINEINAGSRQSRALLSGEDEVAAIAGEFNKLLDLLDKSEERMRLFFERQLVGMAITSPAKGWIQVNERLCQMLGYSREELTQMTWSELTHPDDLELDLVQFNRLLAGEIDDYIIEKRFISKDGYVLYTSLAVACVHRKDGQVDYVLALIEDITKRKQAEEALQSLNNELDAKVKERTHNLELANAELETFSYSVSHDLRAPLRIIDGYSNILMEDYSGLLDAVAQSHIVKIRKSTRQMATLIDDLLRLGKISRTELRLECFNLSELVREIFNALKSVEPDRTVRLLLEPDVYVNADRSLMQIAIENIMANAWKFTGKNPEASIEFATQNINDERICYIQDNGIGFDMAYVNKLFQPFQRLHSTAEFPGTGVGLAIVERILQRHGARVWAESKVGEGARVSFVL